MAKIALRQNPDKNPFIPYLLETDHPRRSVLMKELGSVQILPTPILDGSGTLVVGCGPDPNVVAITYPFGIVRHGDDISTLVYDWSRKYGQDKAESIPDCEFVDETGGQRKIELSLLGLPHQPRPGWEGQ